MGGGTDPIGDDDSYQSYNETAVAGTSLPSPPSENGIDEEEAFDVVKEEKGTPNKPIRANIQKAKHAGMSKLFGDDYNITEVYFTLFAACLIAWNSGFVNGTTMSGILIQVDSTARNPKSQMVAGFAGAFTNTATAMVGHEWDKYVYNLCIILSYM